MRFTPSSIVIVSACALAVACFKPGTDGRNGNGVTLTSGTLDSPPPPYQGMPGPATEPAPTTGAQSDTPSTSKNAELQTWGTGSSAYGAPSTAPVGRREGVVADAGVIP